MATDTLQSTIQLAVPSSAVDVPKELSSYFQQIYSSFHTLQDVLTSYLGQGTIGVARGSSTPSSSQINLQGISKLWLQAGVTITPGQLIGLGVNTAINAGTQAVTVLADCAAAIPVVNYALIC